MRKCKCGCKTSIEHKHVNAKFLNLKHKDNYWNKIKERDIQYKTSIIKDLEDESGGCEYSEVMSFGDDMDLFS